MNRGRARGVLLGLAVGDALGTTQEFSRPKDRRPFPELNLGPQTDVVGGGPFALPAGHTTDDTQMAVCLTRALLGAPDFDVEAAGRHYLEWMPLAFDIGQQTSACLARLKGGGSALEVGLTVWNASGQDIAGNGSLMRTAPIGVHFADRPEERRRASWLDSAITHADPRCILACASFNAAIAHGVNEGPGGALGLLQAASAELTLAAGLLLEDPRWPQDRVRAAVAAVAEDLERAQATDPGLDLGRHQGYVRLAFRLAFWELLHAPSWAEGLLDVTNRGGDADTNAAVAGALLGAHHGSAQIPDAWLTAVLRPGPPGSVHERFHPRALLGLLEDR